MNEDKFWQHIDTVITRAGADPEEKLEALRKVVRTLSPPEIMEFDRWFRTFDARAYRWDLWAAAYLMLGGCSDDAFMDFRASLILQGRETYAAAVAHADSLVDEEFDDPATTLGFEGYQYVADEVFEEKTGKELPASNVPFPDEPAGEPWDEEDEDSLKEVCPNLFNMYQ